MSVSLIGGSLTLAMRSKEIAATILGIEENIKHQQKALKLSIADETQP